MEPTGNKLAPSEQLDAIFAALSDATRRAILVRLVEGEASVAKLAVPFVMTQPAISKHLKVLEAAGLIVRNRDAQRRPSRLDRTPLADAAKWLIDFQSISKDLSVKTEPAAEETKIKKKKGKKNKHKKH